MREHYSDELIHEFVLETRDQLPERSYAAVRDAIDHAPQRVVIGPWSTPFMNNLPRYAVPAFALTLLAILGVASLNVFGFKSVPPPGASPTSNPTPVATATPVALDVKNIGQPLVAGTYSITIPSRVTYTFTMPDGWMLDDVGSGRVQLLKRSANAASDGSTVSGLFISPVKAVYPDPCGAPRDVTLVDQSVPAIVDALTHQAGMTASSPAPVQLTGASGMTFTVDNGIDSRNGSCSTDALPQWRDSNDFDVLAGAHERLWVVSPATGNPLVVQLIDYEASTPDDQKAAEDVVTSMTFR